jgi:D-tyrosyl-tRNA(Tyr) deacylase
MRLVIQRVAGATVRSGGETLGSIERGAVVLVGIATRDTAELVDRMADKLLALRYFDDPEGRTNLSLADVGGALLIVSQFTLLADLRRGRRPGFALAAAPELAEPLVEQLCERLRSAGARVESGRFGASMQVELVNDGPFTLLLDSDRDLAVG